MKRENVDFTSFINLLTGEMVSLQIGEFQADDKTLSRIEEPLSET